MCKLQDICVIKIAFFPSFYWIKWNNRKHQSDYKVRNEGDNKRGKYKNFVGVEWDGEKENKRNCESYDAVF